MSKKKTQRGFGPHFTIDAWGCQNSSALNDVTVMFNLLLRITKLIRMNPLGPPVVYMVEANDITHPEDTGVSGTMVFAESHLCVHTFVEKGYVFADVFSCKEFDPQIVEAALWEAFHFEHKEIRFFRRGKNFPRNS